MKLSTKALLTLPVSVAIAALSALPSWAVGLTYATKVESYTPGGGLPASNDFYRKDTDNALGAPQFNYDSNQDFLSLGIGGEAIFSFGNAFHSSVTLWETTWGRKSRQADYDERVEVLVGNALKGDWLSIGVIQNIADNAYRSEAGATLAIKNSNTYSFLRLVDRSPGGRGRDGFDVNAIAVQPAATQPVPEPATMSGLIVAAGGMVLARRRQRQKQA